MISFGGPGCICLLPTLSSPIAGSMFCCGTLSMSKEMGPSGPEEDRGLLKHQRTPHDVFRRYGTHQERWQFDHRAGVSLPLGSDSSLKRTQRHSARLWSIWKMEEHARFISLLPFPEFLASGGDKPANVCQFSDRFPRRS